MSACQFAPSGTGAPSDDVDAGDGQGDGAATDASLQPPDDAAPPPDARPPLQGAHLLLTEVTTEPDSAEFIEILNPLSVAVPLGDYFLADHPAYAQLPQFVAAGAEPAVANREGIVRFPADAVLPPGGVILVAMEEEGFRDAFDDLLPTYAVTPVAGSTVPAMIITANGNVPMQIDEGGEALVLFRWDELNDLVTDVDIVVVGTEPGGENDDLFNKTGLLVDGPDDGDVVSAYQADTATMPAMEFRSGSGGSYKRLVHEGANERDRGGNGIGGHDETSEVTRETWEQADDDSAPTPGVVPDALR